MRYELRNLLFKRWGLWLILGFLLAKIVLISLDYTTEESAYLFVFTPDTGTYDAIVDEHTGPLTAETIAAPRDEIKRCDNASQALSTAYYNYTSGQSTYEDFCRTAEKLTPYAEQARKGTRRLAEQLDYIEEAPADRWLIDERGWVDLLRRSSPDFLPVLLILLLAAPAFCTDYTAEMDQLLLTTPKGRAALALRKWASTALVCGGAALLFRLIEYAVIGLAQGLPCPEAPLTSVTLFADSTRGLTLFGAFALTAGIQVLGGVLLATLVQFLAVCLRRPLAVLSVATSGLLIPYLMLPNAWDVQFLLPLGFFLPTNYLRTDEVVSNVIEEIVRFRGLSDGGLLALIGGGIAATALLVLLTRQVYVHRRLWRRRTR